MGGDRKLKLRGEVLATLGEEDLQAVIGGTRWTFVAFCFSDCVLTTAVTTEIRTVAC